MRLIRLERPNVWSAYNQLTSLRDEINRLFEAPFANGSASDVLNTWAPAVDLYEDQDNLVVRAEVPGLKKEDIDLSLHENTLTISGERRNEKKYNAAQTSREERFFGRFNRSIVLPKVVESSKVKAAYRDGILTVTLPKAENAKPRQIEVSAN